MTGENLGHYELLERIGAGGMGEVWRARDTRLEREVALKLLPEELATDPDRLSRFEREARVVAQLNHPHIVTLHSVEHEGGQHFLTMELVEGESIGARIPRSGMRTDELLRLGIEIADAVGTAHQLGVTHRDLKPDNIMVDGRGHVKVLDFGLAKLLETTDPEHTMAATVAAPEQTREGRILGTASYMSPEQAEGKPVDTRSDVFSLGIVLYEMATGRKPFAGDTPISTISSIVKDTPVPVTELNTQLPSLLGRVVRRCLEKDPQRRYGNAMELRNELLSLQEDLQSGELDALVMPPATVTERGRGWWIPLFVFLGVVALVAWLLGPRDSGGPTGAPWAGAYYGALTQQDGVEGHPDFTPDGRFVVYARGDGEASDIYLQRIGGSAAINLTEGSGALNWSPKVSPDGDRIAFVSDRGARPRSIYLMGSTGESVRELVREGGRMSWSPDSRELAWETEDWGDPQSRQEDGEIRAIDLGTGEERLVFGDHDAVQPAWSPHGHRIAFWSNGASGTSGQRDIFTVAASGGGSVPFTRDAPLDWCPVWSPDGRWLYWNSSRGGTNAIWRARIDERSGERLGEPEAVVLPAPGIGHFAISGDGQRLVFETPQLDLDLHRLPLSGPAEPQVVLGGAMIVEQPAPSPDGQWIALRSRGAHEDLYLVSRDGRELRQLTDDAANDRGPSWTPDGSRILFYSNRSGVYAIWSVRPDGSDPRQHTSPAEDAASVWFPVMSPDGSRVLGHNSEGTTWFEVRPGQDEFSPQQQIGRVDGEEMFFAMTWTLDGRALAGYVAPQVVFGLSRPALWWIGEERLEYLADEALDLRMCRQPGFLLHRTGEGELARLDLATGEDRVLAPGFEPPFYSVATDDEIWYIRSETQGDLWIADRGEQP